MDAPLFHTQHFPSSFYPHEALPASGWSSRGGIPESDRRRPARARPRRGGRRRLGARPGQRRALPPRHRPDRGRRLAALDGRLRDGALTRPVELAWRAPRPLASPAPAARTPGQVAIQPSERPSRASVAAASDASRRRRRSGSDRPRCGRPQRMPGEKRQERPGRGSAARSLGASRPPACPCASKTGAREYQPAMCANGGAVPYCLGLDDRNQLLARCEGPMPRVRSGTASRRALRVCQFVCAEHFWFDWGPRLRAGDGSVRLLGIAVGPG